MGNTVENNLPYPEPTDPPDVAGDVRRLAEALDVLDFTASGGVCYPTYQDLDDCTGTPTDWQPQDSVIILGDADKPIRYAGTGRPDHDTGVHTADELAQLAAAPPGSTYTWTGSDPDTVFGARVWRKTPTQWECVEGDTGIYEWESPYGVAVVDANKVLKVTVMCQRTADQTWMHFSCPVGGAGMDNTGGVFWATDPVSEGFLGVQLSSIILMGGAAYNLQATLANITANSMWSSFMRAADRITNPQGSGVVSNKDADGNYVQWPSATANGTKVSSFRAYQIEKIKADLKAIESDPDHPQHDNLAALKAELEALQAETGEAK